MNPRWAPALFAFLLSGGMSFLVSGVATFRAIGPTPDFLSTWVLGAWPFSWAVACPAAFVFAPMVRRAVAKLVRQDANLG